ncbi:hypothetical protein ACI3KS_01830 [Microbacterium sp. ZW T5_45]|uniref:hypothetical protein n=1 Tax=Microbacterium sp. ZW T5_45 TaxID=3378080 RepID=UPI0038543DEA
MSVERYVLPSGRIATLDTSQPASAVAEARRTLVEGFGAVLEHEEGPAAAATADEAENASDPIPGESTNMDIISDTTDAREGEPIFPIYGPTDPRYAELAAFFATNRDKFTAEDGTSTADVDHFEPSERAAWHEHYCRGREWRDIYHSPKVFPEFPNVTPAPWVQSVEERGASIPDDDAEQGDEPVIAWVRPIDAEYHPVIEQELTYRPDTDEVVMGELTLTMWVDGNTQIRFTSVQEAESFARIAACAALEFAAVSVALQQREVC